jgi:choice-of-anchor B domain-containing protein
MSKTKKISLLLALALCAMAKLPAQIQANKLGNWHDNSLVATTAYNNRYNEVWGFEMNGIEYGVIGSTEAIHIIDISNPASPQEAFRIPGASAGSHLIHRDFKTYKGYLYSVADEGSTSTLQIIDLNNLPASAPQVYSSNEAITRAHNIFIDTAQARLYAVGGGFSVKVLDISNPTQPVLLATYPNANLNLPGAHDLYVKDNIAFVNGGWDGTLWVIDFANATSPQVLGTLDNYPEQGYNHSGWLSDDGKYYFMCDETHGTGVKVVNVEDFSDMEVVAIMQPDVWNDEIPHNCIYRDGLLYLSYYYDGLQVFDVSDPFNPTKVAFYDTATLPNAPSYAGAWGIYSLLPSGNILISDMQEGFFVFEALGEILDLSLKPSSTQFETCVGETISLTLTVGGDFGQAVQLGAETNLPGLLAVFDPNPAMPGETVNVSISNLTPTQGGTAEVTLSASDGTHENMANLFLEVGEAPGPATPDSPFPGASGVGLAPLFDWDAGTGANTYKLEVANNASDFDGSIVFTNSTASTQMFMVGQLNPATEYFWRVIAQNECGETASAIQSFTTEGSTGTSFLEENQIHIYPNPAQTHVVLTLEKPIAEDLRASLFSTNGQMLLRKAMPGGQGQCEINTSDVPPGLYLLKITSSEAAFAMKIMVQH